MVMVLRLLYTSRVSDHLRYRRAVIDLTQAAYFAGLYLIVLGSSQGWSVACFEIERVRLWNMHGQVLN